MEIGKAVLAVLASGGAGAAAWALLNHLMGKFPAMAEWDTLAKRGLAWGLCLLFVAALYAVAVLMRWIAQPGEWRVWVEAIASYALIAVTASQGLHAAERDREF